MKLSELTVLIVEDHEFQRTALERALRTLGAVEIYTAGDGKEAIKVLKRLPGTVDIVISDLMMPDVDGIELIPLLMSAASNVGLILTSSEPTSLSAAAAIAEALDVGLLGAIGKPLTVEKLRPLLENFCQARALPVAAPVQVLLETSLPARLGGTAPWSASRPRTA